MSQPALQVLSVVGSLKRESVSRVAVRYVNEGLRRAGCSVDVIDLGEVTLPLFNPDTARQVPEYAALQARVMAADVVILGSPDYHGGPSGALKNFLDYFWHEFAGKLMATLVASHEKGLTAADHLRTIARQCYAWMLPYGVAFAEKMEIQDGQIASETLKNRLDILVRDVRVYGELLARQRRADLGCNDNCFMAKHRKH
jgi:NAD(P)H-dependent FMN reductase